MKDKNKENQFHCNYHGILSHDGWVKVAKFNVTATILDIHGEIVLVKGKKSSYPCNVHKNLLSDLKFMNIGDTVGIKWNMGKPYIVGFRKKGYDAFASKETGDFPVHSSGESDWMTFFKRIDAE